MANQSANAIKKVADEQWSMVQTLKLTKAGVHSGVMCRKAASLCAPPKANLACPANKECVEAYPSDIVLLLDSSGSIGKENFTVHVKKFAHDLANRLNVSKDGNHMGIFRFSNYTDLVSNLKVDGANNQSVSFFLNIFIMFTYHVHIEIIFNRLIGCLI